MKITRSKYLPSRFATQRRAGRRGCEKSRLHAKKLASAAAPSGETRHGLSRRSGSSIHRRGITFALLCRGVLP
jgi:hypothetical protein